MAQDWTEAVRHYRRAAEQGEAEAQCRLGFCFKHGHGVAQDWTEAVRYYRQAAAQGHAHAQCNLGICFARGRGVAQTCVKLVVG